MRKHPLIHQIWKLSVLLLQDKSHFEIRGKFGRCGGQKVSLQVFYSDYSSSIPLTSANCILSANVPFEKLINRNQLTKLQS